MDRTLPCEGRNAGSIPAGSKRCKSKLLCFYKHFCWPQRYFGSSQNREAGSQKSASVDELIICDQKWQIKAKPPPLKEVVL